MDKNINNDVTAANNEMTYDIANIVKAVWLVNIGIPVSSLFPPGNVIAAANTMVVINATVIVQDSAVDFIHFFPSITKFLCSLVNTICGVSPLEFF